MLQRGFCHLSQGIRNSCSRRWRVWSQTPRPEACVSVYELPLLLPLTHSPPITHRTAYSHNNKQVCTVLRPDRDSLTKLTKALLRLFSLASILCPALCRCIAQSQQRTLLAKSVW